MSAIYFEMHQQIERVNGWREGWICDKVIIVKMLTAEARQ